MLNRSILAHEFCFPEQLLPNGFSFPLSSPVFVKMPPVAKTSEPPAPIVHMRFCAQKRVCFSIDQRETQIFEPNLMSSQLRALYKSGRTATLSVDTDIQYAEVIRAIDALRLTGFDKISLSPSPTR